MYWLYTAATVALFLAASPYFLYQALRRRKYVAGFSQRLGYLPARRAADDVAVIWVHAVSVGEVLAARTLLGELASRYPAVRLVVSTTTPTGQSVARRELGDVELIYFPLDLPWIVNRTLDAVRPTVLVLMETELWPNVLRACRRRGIRTCLVNGRVSQRSFPRYRMIRGLFGAVLGNVDRFCVQDEESARRLAALGAGTDRITVTGNLKFDSVHPASLASAAVRDQVLRFFRMPPTRPVVVAASTRPGEEAAVLRAFARVKASSADALLVLAPRHPERFAEAEQLARRQGFDVARRSELAIDGEPRCDVVVLDSIGELASLYRVATVVFVGGSLVDWGGHNILEPAVFGKPILFGPHMQNFAEIARAFVDHDAAMQVRSADELETTLLGLLDDPVRRASLGAAARALTEANRGATERTLAQLDRLMPGDHAPRHAVEAGLRPAP